MPVSAVKLAVEAILTKMALLRIILLRLSLIFRYSVPHITACITITKLVRLTTLIYQA